MVAITGTSYGYPGSIDAAQWAEAQPGFGEKYWVESHDACRVTAVGSMTRTVRIAGGRMASCGVFDVLTESVDLQLPNPASGTVYYTIVARRTWQASNETTIEYVEGTNQRKIADGLQNQPGVIFDQPLALVSVTRNSNDVVVTDDLRALGRGGNYAVGSELVLTYLNEVGMRIRTAPGNEWVRTQQGTWVRTHLGRNGWFNDYAPEVTGWVSATNRRLYGQSLGTKPYARFFTVNFYAGLEIPTVGAWRIYMQRAQQGSENSPASGTTIASQLYTSGAGGAEWPVHIHARFNVSADTSPVVRVWMTRISGSASTYVSDIPGFAFTADWTEAAPGNDW